MVTYKEILMMGELLRKNDSKYLTLKEVQDLLIGNSGSFGIATIQNYMRILVKNGYLKSVAVNGKPMWEILGWSGNNDGSRD